MVTLHRFMFAAATLLLGRRCFAFRRGRRSSLSTLFVHTSSTITKIDDHAVGDVGGEFIRRRLVASCKSNNFPNYGDVRRQSSLIAKYNGAKSNSQYPWASQVMMMSTVDQSENHVSDISTTTTYDSNDDDDDDNDDDDESDEQADDYLKDSSPSSLLLNALSTSVQSALNNLSKKTTSLQREMEKAQALEETMNRANLIVSNLYRLPPGTTSAQVEDWEKGGEIIQLSLNTKEFSSAQEESDALFALARKMKRGSKVVEELLKKSVEGEEILKDAWQDLESMSDAQMIDEGTLILIQERLERSSKKTGFKSPNLDEITKTTSQKSQSQSNNRSNKRSNNKAAGPRELTSPSGHRVLVGRNRRDNEAICFQLSKPTDIWMHARGCPGAHVLLCYRRGSPEIKDEDLQFAANLAAFYSDARTERRAPISTAEPKHITKPRGAPLGAVSLRQEGKTLVGRPDNVANDLKDAREKSGAAWDEMGYQKGTRSKNKKKTAAVEKAKREKNREDAKGKSKRRKRKEEKDWY